MAKGQKRSTREKKKPKAEKKTAAPAGSPFSSLQTQGRPEQGHAGKKAR
jgi:hypothetical protein